LLDFFFGGSIWEPEERLFGCIVTLDSRSITIEDDFTT
jgi:hypothetical protein